MPRLPSRLYRLTRAGEWWDYKIVPGMAVLYATAFRSGATLSSLLITVAVYLVALIAGATFVGALNDIADRDDDRRAGKTDRIGPDSRLSWLLIVLSVSAGSVLLWTFADRPFLFWTYAAGWIAFCAYSVPPVRLKGRAALGLICDATGAHVVPALLAVALASDGGIKAGDAWPFAVAIWSFFYGVRGIIGHELADEEFDRRVNLQTFVVRFGAAFSRSLVRWVFFPIELVALATLVVLIGSPFVVVALVGGLAFQSVKVRRYGLRPVLTNASHGQTIILSDFYIVFLPLSLLVALGWRIPPLALLIPLHMLLFPTYFGIVVREFRRFFVPAENGHPPSSRTP